MVYAVVVFGLHSVIFSVHQPLVGEGLFGREDVLVLAPELALSETPGGNFSRLPPPRRVVYIEHQSGYSTMILI